MRLLSFVRCLGAWRFGVAVVFVCLAAISSKAANDNDIPTWKKPLPGGLAILGDDGGGEDVATVCDTASHYRQWLDYGHPSGCKKFPRGLRVVIQGLLYNTKSDTIPGTTNSLPLVRILVPDRKFTGYLQLFGGLHPNIPQGTTVHLKREGNNTLRLAFSRDYDSGLDLGYQATAQVIRYDPSTDDRDLRVVVKDGQMAGRSGWVFSLGAHGDDGELLGYFAYSLLTDNQSVPDSISLS